MNCTVLTDSLALSALVFMLVKLSFYVFDHEGGALLWVQIAGAYIFQSLLRADRTYSILVMLAGAVLFKALKTKNIRALLPLLVCALSFCAVRTVDAYTQVPGINGRVSTNLDFVLLDRIVWPNMTENYDSFPKEFREIVTLDGAKKFDRSNNSVMYFMAPLLNEKLGNAGAGRMERQLSAIVFRNQPLKVISDIIRDIAAFFFTPLSTFAAHYSLLKGGSEWNVQCMSTATPGLTKFYQLLFLWGYCMIGFIVTLVYFVRNADIRHRAEVLKCFFIQALLLSLWFGLGDGASVNDRYMLIAYCAWGLLTVNCLHFLMQKRLCGWRLK